MDKLTDYFAAARGYAKKRERVTNHMLPAAYAFVSGPVALDSFVGDMDLELSEFMRDVFHATHNHYS